jgi:hypothetical protein
MEVAEFAGTLKAGEFRAVDTAADEVAAEGAPFWLCRLVEDAFQAMTPGSFAGEAFDAGFYLVKLQWLEFIDFSAASGRRHYRLSVDERMISVHSLIWGEPIKMAKTDPPRQEAGPPRHKHRPLLAERRMRADTRLCGNPGLRLPLSVLAACIAHFESQTQDRGRCKC